MLKVIRTKYAVKVVKECSVGWGSGVKYRTLTRWGMRRFINRLVWENLCVGNDVDLKMTTDDDEWCVWTVEVHFNDTNGKER